MLVRVLLVLLPCPLAAFQLGIFCIIEQDLEAVKWHMLSGHLLRSSNLIFKECGLGKVLRTFL